MPEKTLEEKTADAIKILRAAADVAEKKIDSNAEAAIKVVANAAAEAQRVNSVPGNNDHDLLIILGERMEQLRIDIKELKNGYSLKIDDHEKRISCLEKVQANTDGTTKGRSSLWVLISGGILLFIALATLIIPHWQ